MMESKLEQYLAQISFPDQTLGIFVPKPRPHNENEVVLDFDWEVFGAE